MADLTHARIKKIDAIEGVLDGIKVHRVAAGPRVSAFGISIVDLEPEADQYPEHDHSEEGIGSRMFAQRPQHLGQEEATQSRSSASRLTKPAVRSSPAGRF